METKPGSITFVQVMLWISVAYLGLITCLTFGAGSAVKTQSDLGALAAVLAIISIAQAIFNAIVAVSLGQRRNWARIAGMVLCGLTAAVDVFTMIIASGQHLGGGNIASPCIGTVLNLVLMAVLASDSAKAWCNDLA